MFANVSLIVAVAKNGVIGSNNSLLWYLSEDLKRFKQLTTGHSILMGRKTYESLPIKPLPKRKHLILTSNSSFGLTQECLRLSSLEQVKDYISLNKDEEIFVIGGGQVYNMLLPYCNRAFITYVHKDFEGDTHFDPLDEIQWKEVLREEIKEDEKSGLKYNFVNYERTEIIPS